MGPLWWPQYDICAVCKRCGSDGFIKLLLNVKWLEWEIWVQNPQSGREWDPSPSGRIQVSLGLVCELCKNEVGVWQTHWYRMERYFFLTHRTICSVSCMTRSSCRWFGPVPTCRKNYHTILNAHQLPEPIHTIYATRELVYGLTHNGPVLFCTQEFLFSIWLPIPAVILSFLSPDSLQALCLILQATSETKQLVSNSQKMKMVQECTYLNPWDDGINVSSVSNH